jgi:predicted RNA-binding protein Jag
MEDVEASGKTVDEAIAKALQQLGLDRSQVDVEVVSEGRTGLFGLGGENARVLVKPLTTEQVAVESSTIQMAVDFLRRLLELMNVDAEVTARAPETPGDGLGRASAVLDRSPVHGEPHGQPPPQVPGPGERGRRALQAPA